MLLCGVVRVVTRGSESMYGHLQAAAILGQKGEHSQRHDVWHCSYQIEKVFSVASICRRIDRGHCAKLCRLQQRIEEVDARLKGSEEAREQVECLELNASMMLLICYLYWSLCGTSSKNQ